MGHGLSLCNQSEAIRPVRRSVFRHLRLSTVAAVALAATALAGCVATVNDRGHLLEPDKITQIHPGTTTRDQVVALLGTPSSTGVFDDKSWYYISRKIEQVAFFDPDVLDQQVYVVNFNDQGVVRSVDHKNLKDARDIAMAPGATPAPGRELTFLEQVLGNIGRFNKYETEQKPGAPMPQ
jgi:outer membrane protein assembly factor BamE (lipoprotein component of BamABCDE complex)